MHSEEAVNDHFELGTLKRARSDERTEHEVAEPEPKRHDSTRTTKNASITITGIVYLYCDAYTGRPVYVGQTRQRLLDRDKAHLKDNKTPFDKYYHTKDRCTLEVVTQKDFISRSSSDDDTLDMYDRAKAWMNKHEEESIKKFDTLRSGYNVQAVAGAYDPIAAIRKKTFVTFRDTLMPLLREFFDINGDLDVPQNTPIIGSAVSRIRQGGYVPEEFRAELELMGWIDNARSHRWVQKLKLLREFFDEHGHINVPQSYPCIGHTIANIRSRWDTSQIPDFVRDELQDMGFCWKLFDEKRRQAWITYMRVFERHYEEFGHANIPSEHPEIGAVASTIRQGMTTVPSEHLEQLLKWGFEFDRRKAIRRRLWDEIYNRYREFHAMHGHCNVKCHNNGRIGRLTNSIRSGGIRLTEEQRNILKTEFGFEFEFAKAEHLRRWRHHMTMFEVFFEKFSHVHVPRSREWEKLGNVCHAIRQSKGKNVPEFAMERLNAMGFQMDRSSAKRQEQFAMRFTELQMHVNDHGALPQTSKKNVSDLTTAELRQVRLANWVAELRAHNGTRIPDEFVKPLAALGIVKRTYVCESRPRGTANQYMSELDEFYQKNGHVNVPRGPGDFKGLANVIKGIRNHVRDGRFGGPRGSRPLLWSRDDIEVLLSRGLLLHSDVRTHVDMVCQFRGQSFNMFSDFRSPHVYECLNPLAELTGRCPKQIWGADPDAVFGYFETGYISPSKHETAKNRKRIADHMCTRAKIVRLLGFVVANGRAPTNNDEKGQMQNTWYTSLRGVTNQTAWKLMCTQFPVVNDLATRSMKKRTKWEDTFMPAFREYHHQHGLIYKIPGTHPIIGSLVNDIRSSGRKIPDVYRSEMDHMGWAESEQVGKWKYVIMPAFREHYRKHGHASPKQKHPVLGILSSMIRTKPPAALTQEYKNELNNLGFKWHGKNVAAHVAGYLGIPRAELPAEAAESETVMHCLAEASRLELFGRRSVPDLLVMYREQRARL